MSEKRDIYIHCNNYLRRLIKCEMGGLSSLLTVPIFLFLVETCGAVPVFTHRQLQRNPNDGATGMTGYSDRHREKRGIYTLGADLILRGWRAVNTILHGARQIPSETEVRHFLKPGSYTQALHDFKTVSPIEVHSFTTSAGVRGQMGMVGDRLLTIHSGWNGEKPTLEITRFGGKNSGDVTDIITYLSLH